MSFRSTSWAIITFINAGHPSKMKTSHTDLSNSKDSVDENRVIIHLEVIIPLEIVIL